MKKQDITNILLLVLIISNTSNIIAIIFSILFCIASIANNE